MTVLSSLGHQVTKMNRESLAKFEKRWERNEMFKKKKTGNSFASSAHHPSLKWLKIPPLDVNVKISSLHHRSNVLISSKRKLNFKKITKKLSVQRCVLRLLYGSCYKIIDLQRNVYQLDGIIFFHALRLLEFISYEWIPKQAASNLTYDLCFQNVSRCPSLASAKWKPFFTTNMELFCSEMSLVRPR